MAIRFGANSALHHPKRGVLLPSPSLPRGALRNYHYPQTDRATVLIIFCGNNGVDTATAAVIAFDSRGIAPRAVKNS